MKHTMKLWHDSFEKIKMKSKTIEMRLNDEKRLLIQNGDCIEFFDTMNNEQIVCLVTQLYRYSNFKELYQNHSPVELGYDLEDKAKPEDMLAYYRQEDIDKYGVVGIALEVIESED